MENVRNRANIEILNGNDESDERRLLRRISKPNFGGAFIFELVSVRMRPSTVRLDKPIQHGVSVLDRAKVPMYDWHYGYMKPKYGDNAKAGYTDTDSKFIPRTSSRTSEMTFRRCSTPARIRKIIRLGYRG